MKLRCREQRPPGANRKRTAQHRAHPALSQSDPSAQGYMESDMRSKTMTPLLGDMTKYALDPETVYIGNRIYDEYPH